MIHLQNLSKRREQAGSVFELYVPCLDVKPGQMVALVGDSGCGKSTLLDILALVMQPTQADAFTFRFGGVDSTAIDVLNFWADEADFELARLRREHMGYILQTGGLLPFLTVFDNVCLPPRIKGLKDYSDHVYLLAAGLGIEHCLKRKPRALSIGQRQRAAILRAIAHNPELVLADEPTAAVDKARARRIMQDLRKVTRERDTTVIVVTHDPELAAGADITYIFDLEQQGEGQVRARCSRKS